jgi:hypothetical protein
MASEDSKQLHVVCTPPTFSSPSIVFLTGRRCRLKLHEDRIDVKSILLSDVSIVTDIILAHGSLDGLSGHDNRSGV